jgi:hypothetical protein
MSVLQKSLAILLNLYQLGRLLEFGGKVSIRFAPVFLFLFLNSALAQTPDDPARADTISWTVQPQTIAKKTGRAALTLHGTIAVGWHVYALRQLPEGPTPLLVTVAANDVATADGAPSGSKPIKFRDPAFGLETQFYSSDFALTVPVRFSAHSGSGQQTIPVDVRFQTCNGRICQPPKTVHLSATVDLQG